MLHENQIPESSDNPEEEMTPVQETPTTEDPISPQTETAEEVVVSSPEPETEQVPPSPDLDVETPKEEVTASTEAESSAEQGEDSPSEEKVSEPVETLAQDESETPAGDDPPSPEPVIEKGKVATYESLEPLNEELAGKMEEILKDNTGGHQVLAGANVGDLIHLLASFNKEENVLPFSGKVGLLKRSFDSLKYSKDFDPEQGELFLQYVEAYNRKRVDQRNALENARGGNSRRKRELLVQLQAIVEKENPQLIQEVRAIQDEWKSIGQVVKADMETLYKEYRGLLDKFYQLREVHFELLEYDRKINLQEKERLIQEVTAIIPPEEDRHNSEVWREKMDLLSEIQQQWKAAGHVPREEMERINNEYRGIIDRFFETRQGFMAIQDQQREENGVKKQAILEKMLGFADFTADRPRIWNDASRELRTFQNEWKAIGQAPKSMNGELWSKYREVCNTFFSKKSEFFKQLDEGRSENLEKKRALVERAEEICRGENLESVAKELKKLQDAWKKIGPVPERHSNKLWNRFRAACDVFFQGRREHYQDVHKDEHENLAAKQALIEEVKQLKAEEAGSPEAAIQKIKEIQKRWKEIGRVPYKEKDTIWESFRKEVDAFFNGLSMKRGELRDLRFKATLESVDSDRERGGILKSKITRLRNKISNSQETVDKYSNNILFIAKGKKGDPLRNQIQGEIDKEERLIQDWKKEIKKLNELLKNPPKPEPAPEPEVETKAVVEESAPETPEAETSPEAEVSAVEEAVSEKVAEEVPTPPEPVAEEAEAPAVEPPAEEEKKSGE